MKIKMTFAAALAAMAVSGAQRHPAMHYDRYWNEYAQSFVTKIFL